MKPHPTPHRVQRKCYLLILVYASSLWAASDAYVDDQLDYVDEGVMKMAFAAPSVDALENTMELGSIPAPDYIIDSQGAESALVLLESDRYLKGIAETDSENDGPMVQENYVRIYTGEHVNAGSETDYIVMNFGRGRSIRLWGPRNSFARNTMLTWDLNGTDVNDFPQDSWDEISFWTNSGDGIQIARLIIVHSGVEILDWEIDRWLDAPSETSLGTGAMQMVRKLEHVDNTDHAALHFAACELGKTNGYKYGDGRLWCSEFASWCLWKEGFWTPKGNIGTTDMKDWFEDRNRLYTRSQITSETYVMRPGDYLSLFDGGHSALFLEWIDSTTNITTATRFSTIEGNTSKRVAVRTRTVGDIDRVGKAQ